MENARLGDDDEVNDIVTAVTHYKYLDRFDWQSHPHFSELLCYHHIYLSYLGMTFLNFSNAHASSSIQY